MNFACLLLFVLYTSGFAFPVDRIVVKDASESGLLLSTHDITVIVNESALFSIALRDKLNTSVTVELQVQHKDLLQVSPSVFELDSTQETNRTICLVGKAPGHSDVTLKVEPNDTLDTSKAFIRVTVANSLALITISDTVGWIYFVAWSISFYPQIIINYRRKSVVGLNFDFVTLNIVGFALYSIFNIGLYSSPSIQEEYFRRFPGGLNPVKLNDILFAIHAFFATTITVVQCFIYDRGQQKLSNFTNILLTLFAVLVITFGALAQSQHINWLDFLYYCSYIKLSITLVKYMPQAIMNYRRQSTSGWSIGNVVLDFTGGWLSMMQMIFDAYNFDDWISIFGDPTKFGLGLFSVSFDILFLIQHYVLYRRPLKDYPGEMSGSPIKS